MIHPQHKFIHRQLFYLVRRMRQALFRLTDPHPSHTSSYNPSQSLLHLSPQLLKNQLKLRYLHQLDVGAIDRQYQLLERLKRITRMDLSGGNGQGSVDGNREKRYSVESYYVFDENQTIDRRYNRYRPQPHRNKSHGNIHTQTVTNDDLIKNRLKEHREFLGRFKDKQKVVTLAKRFRLNRKNQQKLRRFQ